MGGVIWQPALSSLTLAALLRSSPAEQFNLRLMGRRTGAPGAGAGGLRFPDTSKSKRKNLTRDAKPDHWGLGVGHWRHVPEAS